MRPRTINHAPTHAYTVDDVTIITTHFNPSRFRRTWETFYEWIPKLPPSIAARVLCYEAVLDSDSPEIDGSIVIRGNRNDHFGFQKEALCQVALDRCTTPLICWIDHDLYYQTEDWLQRGLGLFREGVHAVQLFGDFNHYEQDGTLIKKRCMQKGGWCPGGNWVAETSFLRRIGGFPCHMVMGSGDDELYKRLKGYCDYVDVTADHIWHGDRVNRRYVERHAELAALGFDARRDVVIDTNGLASIANASQAVRDYLRRYFAGRREDG